jgi:hypothetical protein
MAPSSAPASAGVRGPAAAGCPLLIGLGGPRLALVIGLGPRLRLVPDDGNPMTSPTPPPESPARCEPPRVRLEPTRFHRNLLDGSWWPSSTDLAAQLGALLPVLDHVRGPVTRLLLSAGGWATRPHQITTEGRTVGVGYLAGQSPSMMTVCCADGGMFAMRVAPPGSAPDAPDRPETGWDQDVWEAEGGGLGPLPARAVR